MISLWPWLARKRPASLMGPFMAPRRSLGSMERGWSWEQPGIENNAGTVCTCVHAPTRTPVHRESYQGREPGCHCDLRERGRERGNHGLPPPHYDSSVQHGHTPLFALPTNLASGKEKRWLEDEGRGGSWKPEAVGLLGPTVGGARDGSWPREKPARARTNWGRQERRPASLRPASEEARPKPTRMRPARTEAGKILL